MSILKWFSQKKKSFTKVEKLNIPGNLWVKCSSCSEVLFIKDLEQNYKVCSHCQFHFRISSQERLSYIFDANSFKEMHAEYKPVDFLSFHDTESYAKRIDKASAKSKKNEAILIGEVTLKRQFINVGIMDFSYMGGSMGTVVGEKITLLIEKAMKDHYPVIIFTSSGGARMQEGILSLMQMAKTSAALEKLARQGVPFISVLCDPTTGGTSASFAMLGDIHIAEPGALISFAGPRVIEQTIRQKIPKGFQRAEFLLAHGMVDMVVPRKELRNRLADLLALLYPTPKPTPNLVNKEYSKNGK
jgi:acetyl-CoA carboxylase carboxyl transferase subunit beta